MTRENTEVNAVVENSGNPSSEETVVEAGQPESAGGSSEQAQKENGEQALGKDLAPELQDKYKEMQRDYTEKTTKLASERKEMEEKLKSWEEKIKIFDRINSNPKAVEAVLRTFGRIEEPKPEPTEDEIIEKYGSKEAYQIQKKIEEIDTKVKQYDIKISQIDSTLAGEKLVREIDEYGSIKGNEDFWELEEMGLIQPIVAKLRDENPKSENLKILSEAHGRARYMVSNIGKKYIQAEQEKQKSLIAKKKNETMDRGGSSAGTTETIPKSYREILEQEAKKLGLTP